MKLKSNFKRMLSGTLSVAMAATLLPSLPAVAEEAAEKYPYTMFAASDTEGAITINANNFCVNGNIATNGTIVSSGNMNVNGTKTENADEEMIYILKKLNYSYFSGDNVETYADDYSFEDLNININNPMDVNGTLELTGNINLNSGIKAVEDVTINGEVKNTNNSVICSETGDINIETNNVNFSGLIYAPYGDINIDTDNLNLNNVIIIGQTITIDCPSINANYSNSMAELVGTESDIEVELYAFGEYNSDANSIDMEWYTNYKNSSYEIWSSDDNVNYTSVAVVSDATTYQYPITDDFETKYFKVSLTTNYGERIESVPFVVTKTEDGYSVDFLDSDGDGLPDIYENMISTDLNNPDTDGDGLTDYQEVYITGTDSTKYDSVTEGVSDADADSDSDGLTNAQEIELGTDPRNDDTDNDGLSDYDEINVYGTDPLVPDTDGDGLKDGDEPYIGLDPTNPETFDVPDAEYVVTQTISTNSEALRYINTDGSPYTVSLLIEATGYVEGNLTANETGYSKTISNDAILGIAPEFSCNSYCDVKQATITFSIKDEYVNNELGTFPNEPDLQGLKRFMVFKYIEDMNMLLPVETKYDLDNNTVYTETNTLGTYCIMDMEKWLVNLGIEPDNTLEPLKLQYPLMLDKQANILANEYEVFSESDTQVGRINEVTENQEIDISSTSLTMLKFASTKLLSAMPRGEVTVQTPLDVVFLFQINGELPSIFETQKEMIISDCEDLFDAYNDVRVYIIGYEINNAKFLKTYNGHTDMYPYCSSVGEVRAALNSVSYVQTSEYCNRGAAFTKMINDVTFRDNAGKFVFQIMNGVTTVNASYFSELDACTRGNINYSEVMPSGYHYLSPEYGAKVNTAITNTGGLNLTYDSNTGIKIYEHIVNNIAPPHIEFNVIIPTGWTDISLVDVISPDNNAKSDSDNLTDWEEIDTESGLITWDNNGNIQLPTFEKCLEVAKDRGYNVISEYNNTVPSYMHSYFYNEEILPIHSNPCDKDSDNDGLNDGYDPNSLSANNYSSQMIALDNTETVTIIQKCLEYLGYLDMQNQAYGTFGGLSIAATQLFQLNHRTFSDGISFKKDSNDSYFIDLNTYYAILLEAKNNGFTDLVEDIVWFNENYTPKTMPLEEFNASLNPNNPVLISSVKRSDFDKDNVYNDKVDIYVYDYTPILNGILRYGAQEFHFHYYSCNPSPVESLNYPCQKYDNTSKKCARLTGDYFWMIGQVKNNAPYDVKTSGSWNNFMKKVNANIRFSTSSFPFLYSDIIINAEIFGNILFGYAGHAGGFTKKELESGGSLYSFVTTGEFDNTEDSTYVRYGYDLYNNVIKDYDYIHISQ